MRGSLGVLHNAHACERTRSRYMYSRRREREREERKRWRKRLIELSTAFRGKERYIELDTLRRTDQTSVLSLYILRLVPKCPVFDLVYMLEKTRRTTLYCNMRVEAKNSRQHHTHLMESC